MERCRALLLRLSIICLSTAAIAKAAGEPAVPNDGVSDIALAVCLGDRDRIETLLASGIDANAKFGPRGFTPLHFAAKNGDAAILELLLAHGADIDAANALGLTPLAIAAADKELGVILLLLEEGARPDGANAPGSPVEALPLFQALSGSGSDSLKLAAAAALLAGGADPNARDSEGGSIADVPLLFAVSDIGPALAETLIRGGTDCNAVDPGGFPALSRICSEPALFNLCVDAGADLAYLLRREGEARQGCQCGASMLDKARDPPTAARLLTSGAARRTPLQEAVAERDAMRVRALIAAGEAVNAEGGHGETALAYAAMLGDRGMAALLLREGADVNQVDVKGYSPVMYAAACGRLETLRLLLENGGDAELPDKEGWPPLCHAAGGGMRDAVSLLLEHGADPDGGQAGGLPLLSAVRNGRLDNVARLLAGGADPSLPSAGGESPLITALAGNRFDMAALLLEHGARAESVSEPLFDKLFANAGAEAVALYFSLPEAGRPLPGADDALRVAFAQNPSIVEPLLLQGADIDAASGIYKRTLLHLESGDLHAFKRNRFIFLLDRGADGDARDGLGQTPAHLAAANDNVAALAILAGRGFNVEAKDFFGETPRDIAVNKGSHMAADWLRRFARR